MRKNSTIKGVSPQGSSVKSANKTSTSDKKGAEAGGESSPTKESGTGTPDENQGGTTED